MIIAKTERLTIRELTQDDAPFMLALTNDADWIRNIGDRGIRSVEQAQENLANGVIKMYGEVGHGLWMVEEITSGRSAGICGLIKRDPLPDVDLGFAFLPEFRGNGFALEAARACMRVASEKFGMTRVVAIVKPGNERSIALLEKLGFRFETTVTPHADGSVVSLFACEADA
jgi:ribosomal-protein-alanine N-acetyltransferase